MANYEIIIESSADLNHELRTRFGIYDDYLRGTMYYPDREVKASLDWENMTSKEFYKLIKKQVGNVRTAFCDGEEFVRCVKPVMEAGKDALIIGMTSGMSGTVNGLRVNAELMLDDYPDRKIVVVDSLKYSSAIGMLAIKASELRAEGKTIEEVADILNDVKYNLHEGGPMDDLRWLAANGRVSAPKAFFGQLVGVQPFADFDYTGHNVPFGTLKGAKLVDKFTIEYMKKFGRDLENQIIFIAHSDRLERALLYKENIEKTFHPKEVIITEVCESCGANIGPGLVAVFFYGTRITEDRAEELEFFNDYKNNK